VETISFNNASISLCLPDFSHNSKFNNHTEKVMTDKLTNEETSIKIKNKGKRK